MWTWIPKTYTINLATSILPGHLIRTITLLEKGERRLVLRNSTKSPLGGAKRGTNPEINVLRQSKKPTVVGFL